MRIYLRTDVLGALLVTVLVGGGALADDGPIIDATKRGDVEEVQRLLAQGADVNEAYGDGMTALHWAAERGDLRVAEVLIAAGASVEAGTRIGRYTPLHIAAKAGRPEVVAALIEAGVDVNVATTNSGATPLYLAARAGSADAIRLLVQHGADLNSGDGAVGQTPLMFAAAFNRVDAIRVLLEAHADPAVTAEVIDLEARAVRNEAMTHRFWELMVHLYDGKGAGGVVQPPPSVLQAAIEASRQDDVTPPTEEEKEWLSDQGPRRGRSSGGAEVSTAGGMTALLHAARAGHQEAAMVLLDAGADVEQKSAEGVSPLLMALINGRYDLALRLIERGADPTVAVDDTGLTPLYAVLNTEWIGKTFFAQPVVQEYQEATHYDVMRALLEAGADPNARLTKDIWFNFNRYHPVDHTGATPFWRAAHGLDVEAMKMLVAHRADPSIATIHQKCRGGYGCRSDDDDEEEKEEEDLSGVPPTEVGDPGVYPIHMATGFAYGLTYTGNEHRHVPDGWIPAVKYLIELGADVNARDYNAKTPLHNAAATGNNELILLLVEHGTDVRVKNRIGQTVVDMANAPHDRVQPYPETIKLLESLGAEKSDVPPPCIARGSCG